MSEVKHGVAKVKIRSRSPNYIDEVSDNVAVVGMKNGPSDQPSVSLLFSRTTIAPKDGTEEPPFEIGRLFLANITITKKEALHLAQNILKGLKSQEELERQKQEEIDDEKES